MEFFEEDWNHIQLYMQIPTKQNVTLKIIRAAQAYFIITIHQIYVNCDGLLKKIVLLYTRFYKFL